MRVGSAAVGVRYGILDHIVARACSQRPGRTFAAWGLVLLGSFAALAFALTGFTTQSAPTNNPQSERAHDRLVAAFPTDPQHAVTDLVVVRSGRFTVDEREFRTFVERLTQTGQRSGALLSAQTYYDTRDPSAVSADRHATLVAITYVTTTPRPMSSTRSNARTQIRTSPSLSPATEHAITTSISCLSEICSTVSCGSVYRPP
jgi:hypothetical protein